MKVSKYKEACELLVKDYADFAYKNIMSLPFNEANIKLTLSAALWGHANAKATLDKRWIEEPLEEELTPAEKREGGGCDAMHAGKDYEVSFMADKPE